MTNSEAQQRLEIIIDHFGLTNTLNMISNVTAKTWYRDATKIANLTNRLSR